MQQETISQPSGKTYYLAGEYWRSALYLVVGAVILALVFPFAMQMQGRGGLDGIVGTVAYSLIFLLGISLLLPRMRIDAEGVHRRLFFWYWDSWLWEEFRTGQIREGTYLHSFRDASRPFWRRELVLGHYPTEARDAIEEVLQQFTLKPQIDIPESISLALFSEKWHFNAEGVSWEKTKSSKSYRSDEIQSVRVTKLTHEHRGFRKLEVQFEDKTLPLRVTTSQGQRFENWKGAREEEILAFLKNQVPEDRFEVTAMSGPPQTQEEASRRLQKLDQRVHELKQLRIITNIAMVCMLSLGIIDQRISFLIYTLLMALFCYGLGTVMIRFIKQQLDNQRLEIHEWQNSSSQSETLEIL